MAIIATLTLVLEMIIICLFQVQSAAVGAPQSSSCLFSFIAPINLTSDCSGPELANQQQQLQLLQTAVTRLDDKVTELTQQLMAAKDKPTRPVVCPDNFSYFPTINRCYKAVAEWLTWDGAGIRCQQINNRAHLVVIENSVQTQLMTMMDQSDPALSICGASTFVRYWTSGQRINPGAETAFVWKPKPQSRVYIPMSYTNWIAGQPDYYQGAESCLCLSSQPEQYLRWNDEDCGTYMCAMCEIDMT